MQFEEKKMHNKDDKKLEQVVQESVGYCPWRLFKTWLDKPLGDMIQFEINPDPSRRLDQMAFKAHYNLNFYMIQCFSFCVPVLKMQLTTPALRF